MNIGTSMNITKKEILKEHSLRHTSCREDILDVFIQKEYALSHADIEEKMSENFDRVTVYRTLKTFLDKGIIHKVLDDEGTTKYALCKEKCSHTQHHHEHVHFKCVQCGQTNCLDNTQIPILHLPEGYNAIEINLLVQGICQECNHK